ncbi:unnamed protein product, partial [Schistosoma turkestanicum]
LNKKLELSIVLPDGYPSCNNTHHPVKPIITLRLLSENNSTGSINLRELSSRFNDWLNEITNTGEPILIACIDWLQNELLSNEFKESEQQSFSTTTTTPNSIVTINEKIVCLWIISHHIRSPIKRRLILEWSKELQLTGCCMPGRPGLVIVEGEESK